MRKQLLCLGCALLFPVVAFSQIGIGTLNPNPNVVLDVDSDRRGMLVPRVNDLTTTDTTLYSLVIYTKDKSFYVFTGKHWERVNTFIDNPDTAVAVSKNNLYVDSLIIARKKVSAPLLEGNGVVPIGGIIMWSGTDTSQIPSNFALCDGRIKHGRTTPNLSGKFVVGYNPLDSDYNGIGKTGGESKIKLEEDQLPSHKHTVIDKGHRHNLRYNSQFNLKSTQPNTISVDATLFNESTSKVIPNNDTYKVGIQLDYCNIKVDDSYQDRGVAIDIRPPYYVIAYIMRVQ